MRYLSHRAMRIPICREFSTNMWAGVKEDVKMLKVCLFISLHPAPGHLSRWSCTRWRHIPVLTLRFLLDSCTWLQTFCQTDGIIPKVGLFECWYPAPNLPADWARQTILKLLYTTLQFWPIKWYCAQGRLFWVFIPAIKIFVNQVFLRLI